MPRALVRLFPDVEFDVTKFFEKSTLSLNLYPPLRHFSLFCVQLLIN
jgi:hypothetical protein